MRISDWSSDVCSSDLLLGLVGLLLGGDRGGLGLVLSFLERLVEDLELVALRLGDLEGALGARKALELLPVAGDLEDRGNSLGRLRSEEHTSELQSLMRISYAVFCLKKKTENEYTK